MNGDCAASQRNDIMKTLQESAASAAAQVMMSPHEPTARAPAEELHPYHKRPLPLSTEYDTTEDSRNLEDLRNSAQLESFRGPSNPNNNNGSRGMSVSAFSSSAASTFSYPGLDFKRSRYREPSIYNEDDSESEMDCSSTNNKFNGKALHFTTSSCDAEEIEEEGDGSDDRRSFVSAPPTLNSSSNSYGTNTVAKNSAINVEQHSVQSSQTGGSCGSTDAVASARHYSLRDLEDDDERPPLWLLFGGGTSHSRPNSTTVSICSVKTEASESSLLSESELVRASGAGEAGDNSRAVPGVGISPTYWHHNNHHQASRNGRRLVQETVHGEMDLLVHDWSLWHIRSLKGISRSSMNRNTNLIVPKSKVQAARREVHRALRKSSSSAM